MSQVTQHDRGADRTTQPIPVSDMTPEQRRAHVQRLAHEVADWSAELNRRLA